MLTIIENYEKEAKEFFDNYSKQAEYFRYLHKSQIEKRLYEQFYIDLGELSKNYKIYNLFIIYLKLDSTTFNEEIKIKEYSNLIDSKILRYFNNIV